MLALCVIAAVLDVGCMDCGRLEASARKFANAVAGPEATVMHASCICVAGCNAEDVPVRCSAVLRDGRTISLLCVENGCVGEEPRKEQTP